MNYYLLWIFFLWVGVKNRKEIFKVVGSGGIEDKKKGGGIIVIVKEK